MERSRESRAKLNIVVSLAGQIVVILCGLVVPRLMIGAFGSEAYGATASIAQFLAYITLLEGGIGGVARAALYKPLAENDIHAISRVIGEIKRFFRVIAYIFLAYVLVLAFTYRDIADVRFLDQTSTFALVIIISISTFAQYFIGISYTVLLQAAQRSYITNLINILTTLLNTAVVVILVYAECSLLTVKLISSFVFVLRPVATWLYARRLFALEKCGRQEESCLQQKWTGLGQHIAFFLHSNTDVAVLTVFADLSAVAVYSVYNMVISHMQTLAQSFTSGMEAVFGDMLAKGEQEKIHKTFGYYETLISVVTMILFGTTIVMITPFVRLYTAGVEDASYIEPVFAVVLALASVLFLLRTPYHAVVIAAGHFRETRLAAYGEAVINIGLSIALVHIYGLIGVAVGTLVATAFRFIYYVLYLRKYIVQRSVLLFFKRLTVNAGTFLCICLLGAALLGQVKIVNYFHWACCAAGIAVLAAVVTVCVYFIFYRTDFGAAWTMLRKKTIRGR